jgi:DHA2 family multidrug resistance protein-like MFS transporter
VAAAGACVVSLDSTVNVAFPAMAADFAIPPERVRWVIVCYVLVYALMAFVAGALADRLGHARVFQAGLAVSALAFGLAGVAPTFEWLLAARALQGIGVGAVYGTAPGLVTLASPPEARGRALGLLNAGMGIGLTLGPAIAGVLVAALGWRSIFTLRVPLALATLAWALAGRPPARTAGAPRLVAARDFRRPSVLRAGALAFLANGSIFVIWTLAPFYLVHVRGLDEAAAGVVFMLTPLGTAVGAPVAGILSDRIGTGWPVVAGLALEALGLGALHLAGAATPLPVVALALFATGLGLGVFQVPNMASVMAAFPATQQGAAGGFTFLARTLGVVVGVLGLSELFARRRVAVGLEIAFTEAVLAAALVVGAAAVAAAAGSRRGAPAR